jgi:hypothetical protein
MKIASPIALYYAKRANDANNDIIIRMTGYAALGIMTKDQLFIEVPDITIDKPQYVWRNGARVKVK